MNTAMRRLVVLAGAAMILVAAGQPTEAKHAEAGSSRPPLDGCYGQAVGRDRRRNDLSEGGNAVDAACAMIAATSTMWDTLSWGGETQALIYNPNTGKVIGINALGVAPTGATPEFFHKQGHEVST